MEQNIKKRKSLNETDFSSRFKSKYKWFIDEDIPIFTQDKTYINEIIYKGEE